MEKIFLCIFIADFVTGLLHWLEDTYGLPTWPIIGQEVIEPNIQHHEHPGWIGSMSTIVSRNYQTMIPATAAAMLAIWAWGSFGCYFALTVVLAGLGNEVHTWCHRSNGRLISFLQGIGLAQSPRQHAKHHRAPFDSYFCTLTNFTNECLELVNFWRGLEWAVSKALGIHPKRMSPERRGV